MKHNYTTIFLVLCGRLPTFVCFLELCRLCIFGFTSNNFLQNTKNLLGDDHNQEMKIFNFGFSILVFKDESIRSICNCIFKPGAAC